MSQHQYSISISISLRMNETAAWYIKLNRIELTDETGEYIDEWNGICVDSDGSIECDQREETAH